MERIDNAAWCAECGRPASVCAKPKCSAVNQTLAQFCRCCGGEVNRARISDFTNISRTLSRYYPGFGGPSTSTVPSSTEGKQLPEPPTPQLVEVPDVIREPPKMLAQFLWFLTASGRFYRLALRAKQAELIVSLPEEFGRSSLLLSVRSSKSDKTKVPVGLAASSEHLVAVNLVTRGWHQVCSAVGHDRFLSDIENNCHLLAEDPSLGAWYLLAQKGTAAELVQVPRDAPENAKAIPVVTEGQVAGPWFFRGRVFCYTAEAVHVLSDNGVAALDWPKGFQPFLTPQEGRQSAGVHTAVGTMPCFVSSSSAYVLGTRNGKPALSVIGSLDSRLVCTPAILPKGESMVICQDSETGEPLLHTKGAIVKYSGCSFTKLTEDEELVPDGLPGHVSGVTIGRVAPTAGGTIRFYGPAREHGELRVAQLKDYAEGVTFIPIGNGLMHIYVTNQQEMRALIWQG